MFTGENTRQWLERMTDHEKRKIKDTLISDWHGARNKKSHEKPYPADGYANQLREKTRRLGPRSNDGSSNDQSLIKKSKIQQTTPEEEGEDIVDRIENRGDCHKIERAFDVMCQSFDGPEELSEFIFFTSQAGPMDIISFSRSATLLVAL